MAYKSRLGLVSPTLEHKVDSMSSNQRRQVCVALSRLALERVNLVDPLLSKALDTLRSPSLISKRFVDEVRQLVNRLDNEYLTLHESSEEGECDASAYEIAFSRARAASVILFALDGDAAEAAYEAQAAIGDIDGVMRAIATETDR